MRKIAILNFKGGTGKTTTAVNLSHALALRRQSVLVVDCSPQGNMTVDLILLALLIWWIIIVAWSLAGAEVIRQ